MTFSPLLHSLPLLLRDNRTNDYHLLNELTSMRDGASKGKHMKFAKNTITIYKRESQNYKFYYFDSMWAPWLFWIYEFTFTKTLNIWFICWFIIWKWTWILMKFIFSTPLLHQILQTYLQKFGANNLLAHRHIPCCFHHAPIRLHFHKLRNGITYRIFVIGTHWHVRIMVWLLSIGNSRE